MKTGGVEGRTLAVFYGSGGLLCALSLLPGWLARGEWVVFAVGFVAIGVALVIGRRSVLPQWGQHALVGLGCVLIAAVTASVGEGLQAASFASYCVFVVAYAALFFSLRLTVIYTASCLLLLVGALCLTGTSVGQASHFVLLLAVTTGTVGLVIWRLVAAMRRAAECDVLTGLYNETGLRNRTWLPLRQANEAAPSAVFVVAIDGFAEATDALGRRAAQDLLRQVAIAYAAAVSPWRSVVARLDGHTFVSTAHRLEPFGDADLLAELRQISRTLADQVRGPYSVEGVSIEVGFTIGVAFAPAHGRTPEQLIQRAAAALAAAVAEDRTIRIWDPDVDRASREGIAQQTELREALQRGELRVHYQPLVAALSADVVGAEALLRWEHPQRGLLPPAAFLEQAERSPLIVDITAFVLDTALAQAARWRSAGRPLGISVNLSARLLVDKALPDRIRAALARHGIEPAALTLEITESAVMAQPRRAVELLQDLREVGVRLSVDDFGTGNTSLALLTTLPVDELKIDRRFVSAAFAGPADAELLRTMIQLGRRLGLQVVVEGIEDQATRRLLVAYGCDVLQGYLLGRPGPAQDILAHRPALPAPRTAPEPVSDDHETARLAALHAYGILDTAAEQVFDDIAALAAHICGTPIALLSLVDADRQWFKARVGVAATQTPRDQSFCAHSIETGQLLEVPDATADPRFAANPLVTGQPDIRFYAGAPLTTDEGLVLGALCVIDRTPRKLTSEQRAALSALSRTAMSYLAARGSAGPPATGRSDEGAKHATAQRGSC